MRGRLRELLAGIDQASALAFVEEQIGVVLVYDDEHGSDLADQLEQALDDLASQPLDRPTTARPLPLDVMHALELLNADLDRPSDRLALHLALKLHSTASAGTRRARHGAPGDSSPSNFTSKAQSPPTGIGLVRASIGATNRGSSSREGTAASVCEPPAACDHRLQGLDEAPMELTRDRRAEAGLLPQPQPKRASFAQRRGLLVLVPSGHLLKVR